MSDQFVAEIRIFPFNFAPTGWALCNGQLLPISQNTALFSLLGTTYGGDGKSNFALPDLQGSTPMQQGQGPGLSLRDLGEGRRAERNAAADGNARSHSYVRRAATGSTPAHARQQRLGFGAKGRRQSLLAIGPSNDVPMSPLATSIAGGNLPHNNMMPYLTLNFCIALQGIFPPRS